MRDFDRVDVAVVGGGPAGLATALLLAETGLDVALIRRAGAASGAEVRTTALLAGSIALLRHLGVWDAIAPETAPLQVMRLIDDTERLIRAPTVSFAAAELGLDAFGHNVPNHVLDAALEKRSAQMSGLKIVDALVHAGHIEGDYVRLSIDTGRPLCARLVAAADGRDSIMRECAGITVSRWRYEQTAITLNLAHSAAHRSISTEFHKKAGPFTLVPLPGQRSSLVAVCRPSDADFLMSLPDEALADEIEHRAHSLLGAMQVVSRRGQWPLSGLRPHAFARNRVALIGEAAHVMPPIGAQGLNLGLRDAATLAELVGAAARRGDDIGDERSTSAYDHARRADVWTRLATVDVLNRTLLSPLLPAQVMRGLGLFLADQIGPLRRILLREGVQPNRWAPVLMRDAAA